METEIKKQNTFVSGSIEDLSSCDKIILYRSDSFSKINITNMNSIIELLINTGNYLILNRQQDNNFIYDKIDINNNIRYTGFNIIIYLNHLDIPIGYTEFSTVKGLIPNIVTIKTEFTTQEIKGDNNTEIINSLDDTIKEYVSLTDKLINNQLYITKRDIISELEKENIDTVRYTNSISDIIRDPQKIIYTPRGILTSEGFKKLNLITEMDLTGDEQYFQLGYYNGEIIIYIWNDNYLTIKSLSRKDLFGNNIIYLYQYNIKDYNPKYFSGKYMSATKKEDGATIVVDVINDDPITLENNSNHIIDLWGTHSQIIELPNPLNKRNLIECLPDVLNLKIDIKNYKQTIRLDKKIGDWYVFKEKRSNLSNIGNSTTLNFKVYTNLIKTVTICEEYDREPIIINNNIIAIETKENGKNYYTYFLGERDYYSENALMALDLVMGKLDIDSNKFLNENQNCIQYGDTNSEYYENGELIVDHIGSDIINSYCFNLRKNKCPDDFKVPQFIGAVNGLIYYKTENKIKLL